MKKAIRILAGFSMLLSVAACQKPVTERPELTNDEIRAEEMAQQRMVDKVKAEGGVPKNWKSKGSMRKQFEQVAERIEKAGADICREMKLPEKGRSCYYYFDIKYDDDLNAHADGQKVIVNSGMLRFLNNDDELATILGHELAHNLMGHVDASRTNTMAGMVVGVLVDSIAATQGISTGGTFGSMGQDIGNLSYSVEFEEEADYVGLYIMSRAGYNPNKAPDVWRRMSIEFPDNIYNAHTHPSNASRYVALKKTINEIDSKRNLHLALLPEMHNMD